MLWLQERVPVKHLRVVKSGSGTKSCRHVGKKALGRSKVEEFCAEIGQTEPHAKTVDKKPKDVKKLEKVNFEVEAMETNGAKIENEPSDAEVAKIKNESKDAKLRWMHTMD